MGFLRDIVSALRLLTVVPVPGDEGEHPVRYFTLVGWLYAGVGLAVAALFFWLGRAEGLGALLAGALVVVAWGALSGFLHWDGLADSADGVGVRGDATRRLAVMRDSTVGAFGVTAIVLVALVQVVAVAVVVESGTWWALGAAPLVGRFGAAVALGTRPTARTDGLGASYAVRLTAGDWIALILFLLPLIAWPFTFIRALATLVLLGAACLVPAPFARGLGGITGDVLGATVVLSETVVLVAGALLGGLIWLW